MLMENYMNNFTFAVVLAGNNNIYYFFDYCAHSLLAHNKLHLGPTLNAFF